MKYTISTFLLTTLHFVLARSSVATTIALPPVMAAFPFIPVLAYTLIISAFSYISARILKHFNFNSDLLTFLRRKSRFIPLSITHSHELLPTSTATHSETPSIGVYAASGNVTIPRSASLDILPVLAVPSPRLISPASSPPQAAQSQSRRVTNPSLTSFSILKPTVYRHRPRRSRSLGVPIPRPEYWPSHFPPSPPTQQNIIISGRRRDNEDDIPLALLSRTTDHLPRELPMLEPSPMFQEPSISVPPLLMLDPFLHVSNHGPLIDISPSSSDTTSSSSHQSSSLVGLSSSTEPVLHSDSISSDSSSPSRLTQGSDIGAQPMGELGGFAYDWGFENANFTEISVGAAGHHGSFKLPGDVDEQRVTAVDQGHDRYSEDLESQSRSSRSIDEVGQVTHDAVRVVSDEASGGVSGAPVIKQWNMSTSDGIDHSVHVKLALSEPDLIIGEDILRTSTSPVLTSESVIPAVTEDWVDKYTEKLDKTNAEDDNMNILDGAAASERSLEASWDAPLPLQPSLIIEDINIEDRPSAIVDISSNGKVSDSLCKEDLCLSPLSSSQIPTPPASPLLVPISPVKTKDDEISTTKCLLEFQVTENDTGSAISLEAGQECEDNPSQVQSPERDEPLPRDKPSSPIRGSSSPTDSPKGSRPAWSARAADAPSLGLSTTHAASVQEEVAWPRKVDMETENVDAENVRIDEGSRQVDAMTRSDDSVSIEQEAVQVPAPLELKPSVPGTFPEAEAGPAKEQTTNLSVAVPSTAVATVFSVPRRRQNMRGLPIDVALAMQMRPGLGVGADPAWMVRFLMAVFGWFAIMIAGRGGEVDVYAL